MEEELELKTNSTRSFVSFLIRRWIKKKTGIDMNLEIQELSIKSDAQDCTGLYLVSTKLTAWVNKKDIVRVIKED